MKEEEECWVLGKRMAEKRRKRKRMSCIEKRDENEYKKI